ncbi:hypothetical protein [Polaribacter marinivivus]|uniref:hypothetical protein n=1 Tax=Polaribacter marinivivus TaxID=1524260 RepID=UPI003D3534C4
MKLNDETIIQKFLKRINNSESKSFIDLEIKNKLEDNLKEHVRVNDLTHETLKKLRKNSNLRIYCIDHFSGLGYVLPKSKEKFNESRTLTKEQLREYVLDESECGSSLGQLSQEFSNGRDDALLIGKNLNEKDVQNLYFGLLEHTTYIDVTEWFIEFVELCDKVVDKNVKNDFDEQFIDDVLDFVDDIKNNGKYPLSAINLFERFLDGPGEDYDFYFGGLIKSDIYYVGSTLYNSNNLELDAAIISGEEEEWCYRDEQNLQLKFYLEQK